MTHWEDRYIGTWVDDNGTELSISKCGPHRFAVSIRRLGGPVARPWIHETESMDLNGTYTIDPVDGDAFEVDLGGSQLDLRLVLSYEEFDYLRPEGGEILSAALWYAPELDDAVTDAAAELYLSSSHFHRLPTQKNDEQ